MMDYLRKLFYLLTGSKLNLLWILFAFISASLMEAFGISLIAPFLQVAENPSEFLGAAANAQASPGLLKRLVVQFANLLNIQTPNQLILYLGIFVIVIFLIKSVVQFYARALQYRFLAKQKRFQMQRLLWAYLNASYRFHMQNNSAALIQNVIVGSNLFIHGSLFSFIEIIANGLIITVLMLLLALTDLKLLALMLGTFLPVVLVYQRFGQLFRLWGHMEHQSIEGIIRIVSHSLGGFKEIWVLGCKSYFLKQMEDQTRQYEHAFTLYSSATQIPRILIESLLMCSVIFYVLLSQLMWGTNMKEVIAVMSVFGVAAIRLIPAISQLMQALGSANNSSFGVSQLYRDLKQIEAEQPELLNLPTTDASQQEVSRQFTPWLDSTMDEEEMAGKAPIKFEHQVELRNLTFSYQPSQDPSLDGLNLVFPKGKSIALIGKSGAGKTTLVDVLLGLLTPQSGGILVDGRSVYENLRSWQNLIGYIPQSIFLMDDTLEHNVAFGVPDEEIDHVRMQWALKAAQLQQLVLDLPEGIKTPLGERGVRLSGGQRQRIGIARCLYHEREIFVLDEATSALDQETEGLVTEAIASLAGIKTLIVIAHRLTTIEHCDHVYMLERGKLVKSGSYAEVVLQNV